MSSSEHLAVNSEPSCDDRGDSGVCVLVSECHISAVTLDAARSNWIGLSCEVVGGRIQDEIKRQVRLSGTGNADPQASATVLDWYCVRSELSSVSRS